VTITVLGYLGRVVSKTNKVYSHEVSQCRSSEPEVNGSGILGVLKTL